VFLRRFSKGNDCGFLSNAKASGTTHSRIKVTQERIMVIGVVVVVVVVVVLLIVQEKSVVGIWLDQLRGACITCLQFFWPGAPP
jgi:hypothetical protein